MCLPDNSKETGGHHVRVNRKIRLVKDDSEPCAEEVGELGVRDDRPQSCQHFCLYPGPLEVEVSRDDEGNPPVTIRYLSRQ